MSPQTTKARDLQVFYGSDGTRTRDLRRDRCPLVFGSSIRFALLLSDDILGDILGDIRDPRGLRKLDGVATERVRS